MVSMTLNGKMIQVPEGITILDAARKNHVQIPTLCYLKDINEIAACRVCLVEVEGKNRLIPACDNVVEEGMVVYTNSPKVRRARKTNVQLILSQHDCSCPSCVRSGNCSLQTLANDLGITEIPYKQEKKWSQWPKDFPLQRDNGKCIDCMRCVQICDKVQNLHIWDMIGTGSRTFVDVDGREKIQETDCALCGQCITHCPTGALRERDDTDRVFQALANPNLITVVQIAPAIRTAWGESLGLSREFATAGRLVSALRQMGFHYIFDTTFSADLTIMEEGAEFLERMKEKDSFRWPMFTSCCPGWVRFLKSQYSDQADQLSSAKSPQQMFGAVAKNYYARLLNTDPSKVFCVSIMPCLAKKEERDLPTMDSAKTGADVDVVLTTREVSRMIRAEHIDVNNLTEEEFDMPLGVGTGAGVIFGVTGGVMEAALRSAYYMTVGENPEPNAFHHVRGMDGWKEAEFDLAGVPVRVAVVNGLGNARKLMEALRAGTVRYDFVEVMACPGGCVGGGGQPICDGVELAKERSNVLYFLDQSSKLRFSHENPSVAKCYEDYFGAPLSHKAHELLHTDHHGWEMPGSKS